MGTVKSFDVTGDMVFKIISFLSFFYTLVLSESIVLMMCYFRCVGIRSWLLINGLLFINK